MPRPDEGLIHTWLDGECTPDEAARVERLVATDPAWAAAVAEARGLMAASSRILGALDAVPGNVTPRGGAAAANERARHSRPAFRVRPWMAVAASLVLVFGTATAVRERVPEAPVAAPSVNEAAPAENEATSAATEADAAVADAAAPPPPPPVEVGRAAAGAGAAAAAPAAPAIAPADVTAKAERSVAREEGRQRAVATVSEPVPPAPTRAQLRVPPPQVGAAERLLDSPSALAGVARLEGCWNVTAPEALVGMLRGPQIVRATGDTLVLAMPEQGELLVLRSADTLRGAITATRIDCPPQP